MARVKGSMTYTNEEKILLARIFKKILPDSPEEWNMVEKEYNEEQKKKENGVKRQLKSLQCLWNNLEKIDKPIGSTLQPRIVNEVREGLSELNLKIQGRATGTIVVSDNEEDTEEENEDQEENLETNISQEDYDSLIDRMDDLEMTIDDIKYEIHYFRNKLGQLVELISNKRKKEEEVEISYKNQMRHLHNDITYKFAN